MEITENRDRTPRYYEAQPQANPNPSSVSKLYRSRYSAKSALLSDKGQQSCSLRSYAHWREWPN
ncbi:hypothetical protein LC1981_0121 [Lacticaseibacillus paracasei NRIC 1981]|nr:hypothetical protein LC1981_0121 [Lacticaseibacillus paracasei NRIC 1981]